MPRSTKKIMILLVRYPGAMADWMVRHTRFDYTHASIGLEEDLNTYYSFMHKGFIVEKATRYLKPGREPFPCALYEIEVSRKTYRRVKKLLLAYTARKNCSDIPISVCSGVFCGFPGRCTTVISVPCSPRRFCSGAMWSLCPGTMPRCFRRIFTIWKKPS